MHINDPKAYETAARQAAEYLSPLSTKEEIDELTRELYFGGQAMLLANEKATEAMEEVVRAYGKTLKRGPMFSAIAVGLIEAGHDFIKACDQEFSEEDSTRIKRIVSDSLMRLESTLFKPDNS